MALLILPLLFYDSYKIIYSTIHLVTRLSTKFSYPFNYPDRLYKNIIRLTTPYLHFMNLPYVRWNYLYYLREHSIKPYLTYCSHFSTALTPTILTSHGSHSTSQDSFSIQPLLCHEYHINEVQQQFTIFLKPSHIFIIYIHLNIMLKGLLHKYPQYFYRTYINLVQIFCNLQIMEYVLIFYVYINTTKMLK